MKHHVIAGLLFVFPYLYAMELEEVELVPFLEKKDSLVIPKKGYFAKNYKPAGYGDLPEKLYLARRILRTGLPSSGKVRKQIIEYMLPTEPHLNYEISLHYQTKIDLLHRKIDALEENRCPKIKIDTNKCIDTIFGAVKGGCCGGGIGMGIACTALVTNAYVWLCCNTAHNMVMCDALLWGFPICTCGGCVVGSCCVVTDLRDNIEWK